jgi:hypothetical protein
MFSRFISAVGVAVGACVILVVGLIASRADAAAFTNGSFELGQYDDAVANGHVMSLPVGSPAITGWTVVSGELGWGRNDNAFIPNSATNGNFLLDLTGFHDAVPYGGVTQTADTAIGSIYSLGFDLITQESDSRYKGPVAVQASAGLVSVPFTFTPPAGSTGIHSAHFTLEFLATAATTPITLQGTLSGGGQFLGLDNVTLTLAPEPASLALALLGAPILVARRRARR